MDIGCVRDREKDKKDREGKNKQQGQNTEKDKKEEKAGRTVDCHIASSKPGNFSASHRIHVAHHRPLCCNLRLAFEKAAYTCI